MAILGNVQPALWSMLPKHYIGASKNLFGFILHTSHKNMEDKKIILIFLNVLNLQNDLKFYVNVLNFC